MKNEYISKQSVEVHKDSFIQRMYDKVHGLTFDIMVNGQVAYTSFDAGDAKQFCLDNRLSVKMVN